MIPTCCVYNDGWAVREWGREQYGNPMQLATMPQVIMNLSTDGQPTNRKYMRRRLPLVAEVWPNDLNFHQ